MISPETGLNLVKTLCGQSKITQNNNIKDIRSLYHIQIMVNANPISRQLVEKGDFCKRENENGVDTNRNWDSHWKLVQDQNLQINSGPKPFSEIESLTASQVSQLFKPDIFISIHSGTLGLYSPWAYSNQQANRNEQNMIDILNIVNDKYCKECGVGAAGKEVGYLCPGTCIDYFYENGTEYAFAFEIYDKYTNLQEVLKPKKLNIEQIIF
ncbi:zinc carboxypeptidase family protein, putative [Ichthyophthirius multifiliis]|uniref:Zinc carboxypeptidase family protein, putative n=1 Tax=Ichthyophthirius multifiliis TaxID=5932 RepID=G0QMX6_ICHMU|nr:zinc carboxypeptidase family protein, putative [Ichthyophthirius multifiliis]EGR33430.1 zinc carboxypeptidase family protein, putative [Ichthyophthirius multifiliis]|eukprot:XP_004037416.1 zinc carboxypeptidase family protein, putative [Ichthyophthirius multifiliis]